MRAIAREAAAGDYRFSTLVLGVVKSAPFQNNVKGADAAASHGAPPAERQTAGSRQPCSSQRSICPGAPSCAVPA